MKRSLDMTEDMRARANAMDALEASGALDDNLQLGYGGDDIDRQLTELTSGSEVDDDLARMKAELGTGGAPAQGELGAGGAQEASPSPPERQP